MQIQITKHQLNLLNKRNAAAEAALSDARVAAVIAQTAQKGAEQVRGAFIDIISSISAERGNAPAEYASIRFGEEDGKCFLELTEAEKPKQE